MTQIFTDEGKFIPVTVIEAGPCVVVQKKTAERDGYDAIQIGYGEVKDHRVNKPLKGHFAKAEARPVRLLREFRVDDVDAYELGQEVKADLFQPGDLVDISGKGRGKGFAGTIKRHGTSRGAMSHGSRYHRGPGSMGASATPSRVRKGKKLPGRMGGKRVTLQGLELVRVDAERNLLLVKGNVPGPRGGYLEIRSAVKAAR